MKGLVKQLVSFPVANLSASYLHINYSMYSGFEKCARVYNGVSAYFDKAPIYFLTCQDKNEPQGRITQKSIEIIYKHASVTFKPKESDEFMSWDGNGLRWIGHLGAEDPRVMEYNNELYMYYTMNNPYAERPVRGMNIIKISDAINGKEEGQFLHYGNREMEKNWLFLNNGTQLLVLYDLFPYLIGEIAVDQFIPRIQRNYKCIETFKLEGGIHFASNAIKIDINGTSEYMFLFNYIRGAELKDRYITHIGFMQAEGDFEILRISAISLNIGLPYESFQYISSLAVKGRSTLNASKNDIIVIGGGLDDSQVFQSEVSLADLLKIPTIGCTAEYSNRRYFKPDPMIFTNEIPCDNEFTLGKLLGPLFFLIVLNIGLLAFMLKLFNDRNRKGYESIELVEGKID